VVDVIDDVELVGGGFVLDNGSTAGLLFNGSGTVFFNGSRGFFFAKGSSGTDL